MQRSNRTLSRGTSCDILRTHLLCQLLLSFYALQVRLVHVPCLLAESVILADDIELCKNHLWT